MLNSPPTATPPSLADASFGAVPFGQLVQRETFIGSAALFRICQVLRLRPGPHGPGHPQADTRRVFVSASALRLAPFRELAQDFGETCVCLHALSSFQRTDRVAADFAANPQTAFRKGTF